MIDIDRARAQYRQYYAYIADLAVAKGADPHEDA